MIHTKIQWSDDTCNPVMGCDGCELWATSGQIVKETAGQMAQLLGSSEEVLQTILKTIVDDYQHLPRKELIDHSVWRFVEVLKIYRPVEEIDAVIASVKGTCLKCYAGKLTEIRGRHHSGFPDRFDEPREFPGRMAKAAAHRDLTGTDRPDKPWLNGLPRCIFVSDMGDALSTCIPFEYLKEEIIDVVSSENGRRHIWQWLTKRPARMAQFARWLEDRGIAWPDNLIAMTSVTSVRTVNRAGQLNKVKCRLRGLSVEPLWTSVEIPLEGIDWVIVGGESGKDASPFELDWARSLREQCRKAGVAFFMKQLGSNPIDLGVSLHLEDHHGGDWAEWPADLRIREVPDAFCKLR